MGCWSSSSESDDVLSSTCLVGLFLAVDGPRRGLLFFAGGVWSSSSSSSSKVVGSLAAALRLSVVRARLSGTVLVYDWVGWSSLSCSLRGLNEGRVLLCCVCPSRSLETVGALQNSGDWTDVSWV